MKDNLEKLVRDNRESFDHREPGDVWRRITPHLPGKPYMHWMWKAAAIIFFLSTLALGYQQWSGDTDRNLITQEQGAESNFNEVEDFYFSQISEKRILIDELQPDNITDIDELAELQKLDAMYLVLRKQYQEEPSAEVIDAMTLNLLVRIDLLNKTIEKLDKPQQLEI
jgi:hypothetical protein